MPRRGCGTIPAKGSARRRRDLEHGIPDGWAGWMLQPAIPDRVASFRTGWIDPGGNPEDGFTAGSSVARPLLPQGAMRHFFHTVKHYEADGTHRRPMPRRVRVRPWTARSRLRCSAAALAVVSGLFLLFWPGTSLRLLERLRGDGILEADRQPVEVLLRRIDWSAANGQNAEVARLCEAFAVLHPESPLVKEARAQRIEALMALGDEAGVMDELHRYERDDPRGPQLREMLIDVASWQYERGAWRDAAQSYTDLVAVVTRADAWTNGEDASPPPPLGRSLSRWRAHQRAERGRTETERLARFNQALAFERAGDFDAAERAYARFSARFPEDSLSVEARRRAAALTTATR